MLNWKRRKNPFYYHLCIVDIVDIVITVVTETRERERETVCGSTETQQERKNVVMFSAEVDLHDTP